MGNLRNEKQRLDKSTENAVKVLDNLTAKDAAIVRQEILEHYHVDLKKFFPEKVNDKYEPSQVAFEVQEGKLYDLFIKPYGLIALTFSEERKAYKNMQRFLLLYKCDLIFKLFVDIRHINAKIIFTTNGIWAYKNDSELYSNREMAKRMVEKLESEKAELMAKRGEVLLALQAASIESNVTAEAMEFILKEIELDFRA